MLLEHPSPTLPSVDSTTCAGVLANLKRSGDYLEGFVEGWKELIILLELHKRTTTSTFGTRDSRGPFHQSDFGFDGTRTVTLGKVKSPRLLWQSTANPMVPFDGVPFLICGRKVLECQYGPKRDARRRKPDEKCEEYCKQVGTRISRKRGCPATITVRRIVRFPDHALYPEDMGKGKSDWAIREKKADILFRLKTRLRNGQVQGKERFYVQLPCDEAHQLHPTSGEEACMSQKLHPAIIDKIYELVNSGMQDVHQIKNNLHCFVEGEFSLGASKDELAAILDVNNRAYYPTNHDIRNHMYHANQQNKKKRPNSGSGMCSDNKKRRTIISNSPNAYKTYDGQQTQGFNEFFRKGTYFSELDTDSLINARPYGITPPKLGEQPEFCYPTIPANPLEQAQSGLMLKSDLMYQDSLFSCNEQMIQSRGEMTSCGADSAFKTYEPNPMMPTIGSVVGGANHLMQDSSQDMYSTIDHYTTPSYQQPRHYAPGDMSGTPYYDTTNLYMSPESTYAVNNNYLNSPTLTHVISSPDPVVDNLTPCYQSQYSPRYFSKTLGPCTEVIKASMDLV